MRVLRERGYPPPKYPDVAVEAVMRGCKIAHLNHSGHGRRGRHVNYTADGSALELNYSVHTVQRAHGSPNHPHVRARFFANYTHEREPRGSRRGTNSTSHEMHRRGASAVRS
jgi:hypothetical protein